MRIGDAACLAVLIASLFTHGCVRAGGGSALSDLDGAPVDLALRPERRDAPARDGHPTSDHRSPDKIAPVVLATLRNVFTKQGSPADATKARLYLAYYSGGPVLPRVGDGPGYVAGQTGEVDFTAASDQGFAGFSAYLTDGIDQSLGCTIGSFLNNNPSNSAAHPELESVWGLGAPDLAGRVIQMFRLRIKSLSIAPWNVTGATIVADVEWEIWGR